jgi:hypothetical protein
MIWFVIIAIVVVIGGSVLAGTMIKNRTDPRQLSNQEKMTMTKVSGALKHRKSNRS